MPKSFETWNVLPHGPIEQLSRRLWCVDGTLPDMPLDRTMTLVRLDDGRLVVFNPIALDEQAMRKIESWGTPSLLLVPNGWHRLDLKAWHRRYPDARLFAPEGSRRQVEEVAPVHSTWDAFPPDPVIALEHVEGTDGREGLMIVREEGETSLVLNDVVFNLPHQRGFFGLVFRLLGSSGGPRVTRLTRWTMVKDRRALRAQLERLAGLENLKRIVIMHGRRIDQNPGPVLREVAGRL